MLVNSFVLINCNILLVNYYMFNGCMVYFISELVHFPFCWFLTNAMSTKAQLVILSIRNRTNQFQSNIKIRYYTHNKLLTSQESITN